MSLSELSFTILTPVRRAIPTWASYSALQCRDEAKDEQLEQSGLHSGQIFHSAKSSFFDMGIRKIHWCNTLKRTKRLLFAPTNIERHNPSVKGKYFPVRTQTLTLSAAYWEGPKGALGSSSGRGGFPWAFLLLSVGWAHKCLGREGCKLPN